MHPLLICFIERDCTTRLINQKRSWLKLYYGSMMIAEQDMYYVWHAYIERAEDFRHSPIGKKTYALRSQTIERVFADGKEKHAMPLYAISRAARGYRLGQAQICRDEFEEARDPQVDAPAFSAFLSHKKPDCKLAIWLF